MTNIRQTAHVEERPTRNQKIFDKKRADSRPERIPIYKQKNILTVVDIPPGKIVRWVVDRDEGVRLAKFLTAGWEFVMDPHVEVGDPKVDASREVGNIYSKDAGRGRKQYLMMIDEEFYEQDQADKQALVDRSEEAIYAGLEQEGRYGHYDTEITRHKSPAFLKTRNK